MVTCFLGSFSPWAAAAAFRFLWDSDSKCRSILFLLHKSNIVLQNEQKSLPPSGWRVPVGYYFTWSWAEMFLVCLDFFLLKVESSMIGAGKQTGNDVAA